MSTLVSVGAVAVFVVIAALLWPAMYAVWSRAITDSNELGLWRLLRQRGVTRKETAGAEPDLSRAVYRCIACQESPRCDKLLDAGRAAEVVAFCPNRGYLARIAERHHRS
jgi:uncharacterized protein DUF6455